MTMSNLPFWSFDELSVEANGDQPLLHSHSGDVSSTDDIKAIFAYAFPDLGDVAGICEADNLADSIAICTESNDMDTFFTQYVTANPSFDIDQNLLTLPPVSPYPAEKTRRKNENKKSILLSSSVGVGVPHTVFQPQAKLQIAFDLEEKYRPRYKSDYFGQNGRNRKPRYVADRKSNHYITLKVAPNTEGEIRVDWVTIPGDNNERYAMPYQFQAHNESSEVSDCNPIFEPFKSDSTGTVKLYLVLIKAKQDALKTLQPLTPFHPFRDAFGVVDKPTPEKLIKLTPKKLIQTYQLAKSQLVFTLCRLASDGQSYVTEWDSMVYSTVLEEEINETSASRTVCCPNCSHSVALNDEAVLTPEPTVMKRKSLQSAPTTPLALKKQRTLPDEILPIT